MKVGNQYLFKYPEIKFNFNGIENSWEMELLIILPEEINYFQVNDYFVLKIENIHSKLYNVDSNLIKFPFIRTNLIPKLKGNNRWTMISEEITLYKIKDLPDIIECSLNSHEHPSKRNWFIHKNCGFTEEDYSKINWQLWDKFGYLIQYSDIILYFRFFCDLLKIEINKREIQIDSFEDWIFIIKAQIVYDNKFKLKDEHIDLLCEDFARDFLYVW